MMEFYNVLLEYLNCLYLITSLHDCLLFHHIYLSFLFLLISLCIFLITNLYIYMSVYILYIYIIGCINYMKKAQPLTKEHYFK